MRRALRLFSKGSHPVRSARRVEVIAGGAMRTGGTIRALSGKALAWVRASVVILAAGSAGSYVVASHNGAGDLDPTFGTGGTLRTDFGAADEAQAVAIQPDGKIVVAGRTGFGDF